MGNDTITLLSPREIEKMRRAGRLAAKLLDHLADMVKPGVSTLEINDEAERWTRAHGAKSAPLGYHGFPKSICTSINEVICHGIPSADQILKDGDIINIDVTPILEGYHGDTSQTFFVGTPSPLAKKLVEVTRECLQRGIDAVQPGGKIGDIGAAIHYGTRGKGKKIRPGMVFTIEPMINEGTWQHIVLKDGWTAITKDGKLSAQFEHTIAVTETGVEILTLSD